VSPRQVQLGGRALALRLTARAETALARRREPLEIELELYFSCLLRKRVYFRAAPQADAAARARLTDAVSLSFRPVVTRQCAVGDVRGAPALEYVPLVRPEAFLPHWLALDCVDGAWTGEFGY
jgi:hypothetical protein